MLIILTSIILLLSLLTKQISQILQESSEMIFDLYSKRQKDIAKQTLEIFWVTYIHSVSQPLISLHRLYNFQQRLNNLKVNSQEVNENCYNQPLIEIEKPCICYLYKSFINSNQNDPKNMLKNLMQFQTALPTHIFGVQQYMGFFEDSQEQYLFNYPCLDFRNYKLYDPKTRPWYIEAEKAYNQSNFQQYSVRLTGHYLTIPYNDYRFSITLPLINFQKNMMGTLRVHIQSKILQDTIYKDSNKTNLILTTNDGMLLISNLFNNSGFELGTDYFYNETKTGFNLEDWQAITQKNLSNCEHVDIGFTCRQNKIDKKDYYMSHTTLEQYNLKIILYQTKFEYQQYLQEHQKQMITQIQEGLIKGVVFLIVIAIVISIISSLFLGKMLKPLQQIAKIFQITKHFSSQSITQRFLKFKISNNYAGIFKKPGCFISKDVFLFCQCIEQFVINFSTVKKKSNSIYERFDQIKYPQKNEKDQIDFLDYFQQQILNKKFQELDINQKQIRNLIKTCLVSSTRKEY
ncbi:unnamed protein product [Paramecium primaurelia]|uniref:Uncharacterized protein n=1 Tax=Paramecium primaurelia TaxID=5886 RepID=A0A8S1PYX3_PARPR|nr:unnamed protein product [Paramecium primaurelia]